MKGMARERAEFMNRNATFEEERLELFEEHMSYSILKYTHHIYMCMSMHVHIINDAIKLTIACSFVYNACL